MSLLKTSLRTLLLILLLAGIVVTIIVNRDAWLPLLDPNAAGSEIDRLPPDDHQAREAILQGVQAFYAFNSQAGKEAWLENLCRVMSQSGCKLVGMGTERLWERLGTQSFAYSAEVKVLEKVSDRPTSQAIKKASQVWKTSVTLNQPMPDSDQQTETVCALVVTENNQWRFERIPYGDGDPQQKKIQAQHENGPGARQPVERQHQQAGAECHKQTNHGEDSQRVLKLRACGQASDQNRAQEQNNDGHQ